MKEGRSLSDLVAEIERQAASKRDYRADSRRLEVVAASALPVPDVNGVHVHREDEAFPAGALRLRVGDSGEFGIGRHAHRQLAERCGVPAPYYARMLREDPELGAINVNRWLSRRPDERLVRTLDGNVRGYLSKSYRPLDNLDLAQAALPILLDAGVSIVSCEVTETRLYLKGVSERLRGEVKVGDEVQQGIVISNSEVGAGFLDVRRMIYRLVCLNGAIGESAIRRAHVGRKSARIGEGEVQEIDYSDRTLALDDAAFWSKVGDAVRGVLSESSFNGALEVMRGATAIALSRPAEVVEVIGKRHGLSESFRREVVRRLIEGGDSSAWGVANAITRASHDVRDYDTATELETLGGRVIELGAGEWRSVIAEAERLAA